MFEETGRADIDLGPCIWTREHRGVFLERPFHAVERMFLVRVESFEPVADGYTDVERLVHVEMRWWTLDELQLAGPTLAPARLPALLQDLFASGPPSEPIDAGV